MRKTLIVAMRDYTAAVRTKGFIIGLVLVPVLMGGSLVAMRLLENQVDTTDRRIAVVDRTGLVTKVLLEAAERRNKSEIFNRKTGKKIRPAYLLEAVSPETDAAARQRLRLSDRVRKKELWAFVEIDAEVVNLGPDPKSARVAYYTENPVVDEAREWIGQQINNRVRSLRLAATDLDEKTIDRLTRWVPVEGLGLVTVDERTGEVKESERRSEWQAIGVPYAMMLLMFMLVVAAATPLTNGVLEEKMQRIAEVLLGSVRPFQLMLGKLLGSIGVSLTTVAVYMAGGIIVAARMGVSESIPYHALPWLAAFGISAVFMYGAVFIAVGSACNDVKESQSVLLPVWLVLVIPMFVWYPIIREPTSGFATWFSLLPPFAPMLMVVRQSTPGGVPIWQPCAGLVGVIAFTLLCVWAAGRIFRVGILLQGKPPRLLEILRWAARG